MLRLVNKIQILTGDYQNGTKIKAGEPIIVKRVEQVQIIGGNATFHLAPPLPNPLHQQGGTQAKGLSSGGDQGSESRAQTTFSIDPASSPGCGGFIAYVRERGGGRGPHRFSPPDRDRKSRARQAARNHVRWTTGRVSPGRMTWQT